MCNRAVAGASFELPADGFIPLVPKGVAVSLEGVHQLVDEASLQSLLQSARNRGGEILMDVDHESHDPAKSTIAHAWADLSTAVLRDDGLYAKARLTNHGNTSILGGNFRFVSPEFPFDTMEKIGPELYRPKEISGASFTNRPAFRTSKPVTNRGPATTETAPANKPMKKDICKLLKLDENTEDGVVLNRLGEFVTKAAAHDTMKTELETVRNREVDAILQKHDAVIPKDEGVRATLKTLLVSNREGGEKMLEGFAASAKGTQASTPQQQQRAERQTVHNRQGADVPKEEDAKAGKRAIVVKNRAREIQNANKGMSWSQAFNQADQETPE